jgi:hypothetical protein
MDPQLAQVTIYTQLKVAGGGYWTTGLEDRADGHRLIGTVGFTWRVSACRHPPGPAPAAAGSSRAAGPGQGSDVQHHRPPAWPVAISLGGSWFVYQVQKSAKSLS